MVALKLEMASGDPSLLLMLLKPPCVTESLTEITVYYWLQRFLAS